MASLHLVVLLALIVPCFLACTNNAAYSNGQTYTVTLPSGRNALLHIPARWDRVTALPIVVGFHGVNTDAHQMQQSGFDQKADAETFFTLYPFGMYNSWNAGYCCGQAQSSNVDDVGFVSQLLTYVGNNVVCINLNRIYITGFSNGGFMTYRLACGIPGFNIAAVGPVSGLDINNGYTCNIARPVPILHIHGMSDTTVNWNSVPATMQLWTGKDGCNYNSKTVSYQRNTATCNSYSCPNPGSDNVTLCQIAGWGHNWPGSSDLSAPDVLWAFFSRFGSGGSPAPAPTPAPTPAPSPTPAPNPSPRPTPSPTPSPTPAHTSGTFSSSYIKGKQSNRVIDSQGRQGAFLTLQDQSKLTGRVWSYDGTYIKDPNTGLVLDVWTNNIAAGGQISEYPYTGGSNQKWVFDSTTTYGAIHPAANTGLCLAANNGNTAAGTSVTLATCNGQDNQNWIVVAA